jgi:hypothetical protein
LSDGDRLLLAGRLLDESIPDSGRKPAVPDQSVDPHLFVAFDVGDSVLPFCQLKEG